MYWTFIISFIYCFIIYFAYFEVAFKASTSLFPSYKGNSHQPGEKRREAQSESKKQSHQFRAGKAAGLLSKISSAAKANPALSSAQVSPNFWIYRHNYHYVNKLWGVSAATIITDGQKNTIPRNLLAGHKYLACDQLLRTPLTGINLCCFPCLQIKSP